MSADSSQQVKKLYFFHIVDLPNSKGTILEGRLGSADGPLYRTSVLLELSGTTAITKSGTTYQLISDTCDGGDESVASHVVSDDDIGGRTPLRTSLCTPVKPNYIDQYSKGSEGMTKIQGQYERTRATYLKKKSEAAELERQLYAKNEEVATYEASLVGLEQLLCRTPLLAQDNISKTPSSFLQYTHNNVSEKQNDRTVQLTRTYQYLVKQPATESSATNNQNIIQPSLGNNFKVKNREPKQTTERLPAETEDNDWPESVSDVDQPTTSQGPICVNLSSVVLPKTKSRVRKDSVNSDVLTSEVGLPVKRKAVSVDKTSQANSKRPSRKHASKSTQESPTEDSLLFVPRASSSSSTRSSKYRKNKASGDEDGIKNRSFSVSAVSRHANGTVQSTVNKPKAQNVNGFQPLDPRVETTATDNDDTLTDTYCVEESSPVPQMKSTASERNRINGKSKSSQGTEMSVRRSNRNKKLNSRYGSSKAINSSVDDTDVDPTYSIPTSGKNAGNTEYSSLTMIKDQVRKRRSEKQQAVEVSSDWEKAEVTRLYNALRSMEGHDRRLAEFWRKIARHVESRSANECKQWFMKHKPKSPGMKKYQEKNSKNNSSKKQRLNRNAEQLAATNTLKRKVQLRQIFDDVNADYSPLLSPDPNKKKKRYALPAAITMTPVQSQAHASPDSERKRGYSPNNGIDSAESAKVDRKKYDKYMRQVQLDKRYIAHTKSKPEKMCKTKRKSTKMKTLPPTLEENSQDYSEEDSQTYLSREDSFIWS